MLNMRSKYSFKAATMLLIALISMMGIIPAFASSSTDDPGVYVDLTAGIQKVHAGQEARINLPLMVDDKTATDVTIAIADDLDSVPFIFDDSRPWTEVDKITLNGASPYFKVFVSPTAQEKVYEIQLDIEYKNLSQVKFRTTDSIYIKIVNDQVEPTLGVVDFKLTDDVLTASRSDQAIVLNVGNTGTSDANDVRVALKGYSEDGIHLYKGMDVQAIDKIEAKMERVAYFYIQPSENAPTGEYQMEVEITYYDDIGDEYTRTSYIYIPVEGNDTKSIEFGFDDLQMPEKVSAGDRFMVSGTLKNISGVEAEYVEVSIEYPDGFIPESRPRKIFRNVGPEQTEPVSFELRAQEDMATDHYPIYLVAEYNAAGDSEEDTYREYAGVSVDGRSGLGRPKILVDDYSFEGDAVMAGEVFDLHLKFFNTSSDDLVKNIKVSVSSEEGVFSPADSSSSFFIERIERQGYYEYVLPIETKRDAAVKTHNLKLVMEYEDGEGNAYDAQEQPFKEEESLGISVSQPVRLETGDVAAPFDAFVGSPSDVELEFYNMGRSDMYNMFVKLEGDFTSQDGTYFVGNFESGSSDYFMASIIPEEEGEVTGNIVFTFEDALGNPSTVEKPFSFYASGMSDFDTSFEGDMDQGGDFGGDMMLEDGESGSKAWGYAVLAVAVLGGGAWFIIRRRKQKAALLLAMEEDDE